MAADSIGKGQNDTAMEDLNNKSKRTPLVELKNGKVIFKQKGLSFEKLSETLQEIVKFREMLALCIQRGEPPLAVIPEEYKPVIAKLAHENDKTLPALTKFIHNELLPTTDGDGSDATSIRSILPLQAVEAVIKSIAVRNNYGLDGSGTGKVPASVCVWRWEVNREHRSWLPKNTQDKVDARLAERIQAKKDLVALFEGLTQDERDMILNPKGKVLSRDKKKAMAPGGSDLTKDLKSSSQQSANQQPTVQQWKKSDNEGQRLSEGPSTTTESCQAITQIPDPEKPIKEKENVKGKVQRPKKEKKESESHIKSRSIMANFLGISSKGHHRSHSTQEPSPALSLELSEFERTFKPFLLKKDAELAASNWFTSKRSSASGKDHTNAILVEGDEKQTEKEYANVTDDHSVDANVACMSSRERLLSILSALPPPLDSSRSYPLRQLISTSNLKTHYSHTVRDIISQLTEAEISGDVPLVRSLLSKLRNRQLFVPKMFVFKEDTRPGYFGTWTRSSANIGPRGPFKRDPVAIDYGYDSGEGWEDEESGDGDDVVEDGDEDGEMEEPDSDLDSWLVDDDEEIETGTPPAEKNIESPPAFLSTPPPKRKLDDECQRQEKKRKVVPLIPFAKGPCWESAVGQCESDLFQSYRIQLFNDTPFPINPFTFISQDQRSNGAFAIPALPARLNPVISTSGSSTSCPVTSLTTVAPANPSTRRTVSAPKTGFPDAYLPQLFARITSLKTGNFIFLVETIYQELRGFGVKKNAIEAKLKNVLEKSEKVWVIKKDATAALPAPSPSVPGPS